MHRLQADGAVPHALDPALLGALGGGGRALPPLGALAELGAELGGAEGVADRGAGEGLLAEDRARRLEEVACRGHLDSG